MNPHRITTMSVGAVTAAALLSTGLAIPTANATCASFWGIGNGGGCTSTIGNVAIALGTNAQATATGWFGTAFAVGDNAKAISQGGFNVAITAGNGSAAATKGLFNIVVQLGQGSSEAYGLSSAGNLGFNLALNVGADSRSYAQVLGLGNVAVNLFGRDGGTLVTNRVVAFGIANTAFNIGGQANQVGTSGAGVFNSAFNAFGSRNFVLSGPGPFAIAGAILQNNQTVQKSGPGFNINGVKVGGASAVNARKASPAAASKPSAANSTKDDTKSTGGSKRAKKAD